MLQTYLQNGNCKNQNAIDDKGSEYEVMCTVGNSEVRVEVNHGHSWIHPWCNPQKWHKN